MFKRALAIFTIGLMAVSGMANTYYLDGNQQIDAADPVSIAVTNAAGDSFSVTRTGDGSSGDPWTFDFSSLTTPTNIVFGTNMLYADNITSATRRDVVLDLADSNVESDDVLVIRMNRGLQVNNQSAHNLRLDNVGTVSIGGIDAIGSTRDGGYYSGSTATAGDIVIGASTNRVGDFRASYLYARRIDTATRPGGLGASGIISIYGSGDVMIQDSDGVRGSVCNDSIAQGGRTVTIDHVGNLSFSNICTYIGWPGNNYQNAGSITLNGGDSSGDLYGDKLIADNRRVGGYDSSAANPVISISNYRNVTISNGIDSATTSKSTRYQACDVVMENIISNITIGGEIDLLSADLFNDSGYLSLTCSGTVTLVELDVNKVLTALIDAPTNYISSLRNFSTTASSGTGTEADPYITTQTALRAPSGTVIYYTTLNGDIADSTYYRVANESGVAGTGGILAPATYLTLSASVEINAAGTVTLAFDEVTNVVTRTGTGTSADPYVFDFSELGVPFSVIDLNSKMLYSGPADTTSRYFTFKLDYGALIGTNTTSIRTWKGTEKRNADYVTIVDVNYIAIGGIDTRFSRTSGGSTNGEVGDVTIGEDDNPSLGDIRIGFIHAYADFNDASGGDVTIYGGGDVIISDGTTAGDILTHANQIDDFRGGDIFISHVGDFRVRNMETWTRNNTGGFSTIKRSGNITMDGNSSGDAVVEGYIKPMYETQAQNDVQSIVEFKNYDNVSIVGDFLAVNAANDTVNSTYLYIDTGITGDIVIGGEIKSYTTSITTKKGNIALACGGTITVPEVNMDWVNDFTLASTSITVTNMVSTNATGTVILGKTGVSTTPTLYLVGSTNMYLDADIVNGSGCVGAMVKTGTNVLELAGTSTYTGTTTVSNGTLKVSGSLQGTTTMRSGTALRGNGSLSAAVIESGASVSPGLLSIASIGISTLSFADNSLYVWDYDTTNSDEIAVSTVGFGSVWSIAVDWLPGGDPESGTYTLISYSGTAPTMPATVNVTGLPSGYRGVVSLNTPNEEIRIAISEESSGAGEAFLVPNLLLVPNNVLVGTLSEGD